jgi:CDP-diacylglycerol--serine O-phosphatidyltransferase
MIAIALAAQRSALSPLAPLLIVGAVAFDWLDGLVARAMHENDDFGRELDSLVDVVSFGVAPAALVLIANSDILTVAAGVFYVACGAIRLGLFNLQLEKSVFLGMPIPLAALVVLLFYVYALDYAAAALVVAGVLMVSRFKLGKPSLVGRAWEEL